MAKDYGGNLACQLEELRTTPVPRTCRAAFGTSSEVLELDQGLPLRSWSMVAIIFAALFLIWMG